jgi:hypothetical protein
MLSAVPFSLSCLCKGMCMVCYHGMLCVSHAHHIVEQGPCLRLALHALHGVCPCARQYIHSICISRHRKLLPLLLEEMATKDKGSAAGNSDWALVYRARLWPEFSWARPWPEYGHSGYFTLDIWPMSGPGLANSGPGLGARRGQMLARPWPESRLP